MVIEIKLAIGLDNQVVKIIAPFYFVHTVYKVGVSVAVFLYGFIAMTEIMSEANLFRLGF